ncbi:hypothetical protein HDV04_000931 [Boothiomyces sp. JEL0838]|nr:hypothetical protein HDV04_000882 [Boothiomyces sp. JEL0838]KAJ3314208.1 hypothetical protein HDV04_000931 [Boothiomyces sp. JEL0838]
MNIDDEVLLRAIRKMCDPEEEPQRHSDDSEDDKSDEEIIQTVPQRIDKDMERLNSDSALRQHLKIGTAFTGPKGVKQDYKFHMKQERARAKEKREKDFNKLSGKALSSGWLQRTIKQEEEDEIDDEEFFEEYNKKRLAQLASLSKIPRFGKLFELDQDSFVNSIDKENPKVKVVIHLYENNHQACRQVNDFFYQLATKHTTVKFCKIVSTVADPGFDRVALPAILVYQGGELKNTLLRLIDEIPGWNASGRTTLRDFEEYLMLQDVLENTIDYSDEEETQKSADSDEEFFS